MWNTWNSCVFSVRCLSSFKTRLLCPHLWVPEKWAFIIQSFCHPPSTIKEGNPTHPHKRTAIHHLKAIIRGKQLGDTTVIEQRNVVGHIHLNLGFRPQKTDANPHPTFTKKNKKNKLSLLFTYELSKYPLHTWHAFCHGSRTGQKCVTYIHLHN